MSQRRPTMWIVGRGWPYLRVFVSAVGERMDSGALDVEWTDIFLASKNFGNRNEAMHVAGNLAGHSISGAVIMAYPAEHARMLWTLGEDENIRKVVENAVRAVE